jgi:hypothetical protein
VALVAQVVVVLEVQLVRHQLLELRILVAVAVAVILQVLQI